MTERDLFFGTSGPRSADIVIVGESWGQEESDAERPFVGQSGKELDRMLVESGLIRANIFCTNVISAKPKGNETWRFFRPNDKARPKWRGLHPTEFVLSEISRLHKQIETIRPKVVVASGNYALWALSNFASTSSISTGDGATVLVPGGIMSYRGSMLQTSVTSSAFLLLPIIHPAAILYQWSLRAVTIHDLKTRVPQALQNQWRPHPGPVIWAPPKFDNAIWKFEDWLRRANSGEKVRIANDIETARGLITCIGFGEGPYDGSGFAMVVPFVRLLPQRRFESFYKPSEEVHLASFMRKLLVHHNILIEGQNYIYDTQYIQEFFGVTPLLDFDTMLAHHLLFPGTPKGLDYLSSLYCKYHWYWKDDNKEWDLAADETKHLLYNAEDLLRTFECATVLRRMIIDLQQEEQWEWQKRKNGLALRMMNRGVRIDTKRRALMSLELGTAYDQIASRLTTIIPESFAEGAVKSTKSKPWYSSARKQPFVFYERLGLSPQRNRKTGNVSCNNEALKTLKARNPELATIFDLLLALRSVGVFHNTFIKAPLEANDRMKCSFNPAGTETFRWSSSSNAFGRGTNLQNIPKGTEE